MKIVSEIVDDIKAHILCSITFSRKSCRLGDTVEKYGTAEEADYDNIRRRTRFACWLTKTKHTQNM